MNRLKFGVAGFCLLMSTVVFDASASCPSLSCGTFLGGQDTEGRLNVGNGIIVTKVEEIPSWNADPEAPCSPFDTPLYKVTYLDANGCQPANFTIHTFVGTACWGDAAIGTYPGPNHGFIVIVEGSDNCLKFDFNGFCCE